jgi:hypothetical protein
MKTVNPGATTSDFEEGMCVVFVPEHANGNLEETGVEFGIVKSSKSNGLFVNFFRNDMLQDTAQNCNPENMMIVHEIPVRKFRLGMDIMLEIMLDNGVVNSMHGPYYPPEHLNKISYLVLQFFTLNPNIDEKEFIGDICEDEDITEERYGKLDGYHDLNTALNEYFDEM